MTSESVNTSALPGGGGNDPVGATAKAARFQLEPSVLTRPFHKLALTLSGGGFRAAAYSLGTMSYLDHLRYPDPTDGDCRVLDNVEFVSSASGGSFTALLYTMHVRQARPFRDTFATMLSFLNGQVLLEDVLGCISDPGQWQGAKSANFINAFARIYDKALFGGETFGVYWPQPQERVKRELELCVNATEFYRGLSFRFQASNAPAFRGKAGNEYVHFDGDQSSGLLALQKLKLGDILAASSCFPAGFEPILFPDDFTYNSDTTGGNALTTKELSDALVIRRYNDDSPPHNGQIGLMDGGINDNQAVYSGMLADQRRRRADGSGGFDLLLVTDVASYFMDPYRPPKVKDDNTSKPKSIQSVLDQPVKKFLPRISRWAGIGSVIALTGCIGAASIHAHTTSRVQQNALLVVASCFGLLSLVLFALYVFLLKPVKLVLPAMFSWSGNQLVAGIKHKVPALKNFSDKAISQLTTYLRTASFGTWQQLLESRLNSMLSLVLDINLKQTRRLIFDTFYGNFYGHNIWENRRVFNVIYELSKLNRPGRATQLHKKFYNDYGFGIPESHNTWAKESIDLLTAGCDNIHPIAEAARTMGTTLWTDKADSDSKRLRDVIACGQFTTCAKLLEYCLIVERVLQQQKSDTTFPVQIKLDEAQEQLFRNIKDQTMRDWLMFKKDAYHLYNDYAVDETM